MGENRTFRDRYPPPWIVEVTQGSHFAIVSANGVRLAFVDVGHPMVGGLTVSEAKAIAEAISGLALDTRERG